MHKFIYDSLIAVFLFEVISQQIRLSETRELGTFPNKETHDMPAFKKNNER